MDRSLIPPKKYFGFLQPDYVEKRRQALETYLETLLSTFPENLPKEVLEFFETNKFVSDNSLFLECFLLSFFDEIKHIFFQGCLRMCVHKRGKGEQGVTKQTFTGKPPLSLQILHFYNDTESDPLLYLSQTSIN